MKDGRNTMSEDMKITVPEEDELLSSSADLWNRYFALVNQQSEDDTVAMRHCDTDLDDGARILRQFQQLIMARATRKFLPDGVKEG